MAKAEWHKVHNVSEFLAQRGQIKRGPHEFTKRVLHWPYCARCGLVLLKNETTRKLAKKVCETEE